MSHTNETQYGYWTVVERGGTKSLCKCVCGKLKEVVNVTLRKGSSKSCGCQRKASMNATRPSSYLWQKVEWVAWKSMVHRCTSPRAQSFKDYGERGITVCDRWLGDDGFQSFLADMGPRPDGYSIERMDVNAGYSPENCKWIPRGEQVDNTRRSRFVEYQGQRLTATRFAELIGISAKCVFYRLDHDWTVEQIVSRPEGWRPSNYVWTKKPPGRQRRA